jgi:5-formyltetrahydrofolate cyclo-ligase
MAPVSADSKAKARLRREFRHRRRALGAAVQQEHAALAARYAMTCGLSLPYQRYALYWPNDGEVGTMPLIARLIDHGKQVGLPVLRGDHMVFYPFRTDRCLRRNAYGIPEPETTGRSAWAVWSIGVVFLPLVAFDVRGFRLGMGGGYYDRTFAARHSRASPGSLPVLIGLAHALQETEALPTESWDVPMDGVLTEAGYRAFTPRGRRFSPG